MNNNRTIVETIKRTKDKWSFINTRRKEGSKGRLYKQKDINNITHEDWVDLLVY